MENYLVVLLLSVFVLLGALYVNTVERRIIQIKDELLQHGNEIKKVKEELESTRKELTQVKVELESTRKELKQVHVELKSTRKELKLLQVELESTRKELKLVKVELESTRNVLKQVKVELDSTREQINILRKEMIEKDNARKEEIDQMRAHVNALYEELKEIKKELKAANIPVAFYAYLSANLDISSVPTHSIIKYDVVDLNLGNGYVASSGQFKAPSDGLYVFHITTGTRDYSQAVVELISNGVIKDITWADSRDHPDRAVATTVTPLNLWKGDTVNARIGLEKGGAVLESTIDIRCSFSGFKVH
ncbi:unnamed protein product [Mytilus coruscus]|uniref:C1q domain-containing protein n=1 Tax=Mytilus coruscus TaxID=42192 RepID=A0A6J8ACY6_MYTCO|nr:unnamed protein product [Mytilus coruscus]